MGQEKQVLDTDEAAEYLGVSSGTLKRWRQAGIGPSCIRMSYQIVRYRRQNLDDFLAAHTVGSRTGSEQGGANVASPKRSAPARNLEGRKGDKGAKR